MSIYSLLICLPSESWVDAVASPCGKPPAAPQRQEHAWLHGLKFSSHPADVEVVVSSGETEFQRHG